MARRRYDTEIRLVLPWTIVVGSNGGSQRNRYVEGGVLLRADGLPLYTHR